MSARAAAVLLSGVLAVGCASPQPASPVATAVVAPPGTGTDPLQPLPSVDPNAVGLTCGDEIAFHPALLAESGRAEQDPDPAAVALRAELAHTPPQAGLPPSGWVRVAQLPDRVRFLAPAPALSSRWAQVDLRLVHGKWQLEGAGECRLGPVVPPDVTIATWRLDPAFPRPAPNARVIHVLINEAACASGKPPVGRVLPPAVAATSDALTVTILVRRTPGGADCPGNPDHAMQVELPEPLGDRSLLDGGVYPPAAPIGAFALSCGTADAFTCQERAAAIARDAAREQPRKTIVSIEILDASGSYSIVFDDGTGATLIVN